MVPIHAVIISIFNADWLNKHDRPTVFGFSPDIQRWTFVSAGGVPENYSRLQIAWKMRPLGEDEPITKQQFEQYKVAVKKAALKLNANDVRTDLSSAEAEKRSAALIELAESCEQGIDVVLQAPKGRAFEGNLIWDVMLCLGLRWGDMDLFHWENPGIPGDDHLFLTSSRNRLRRAECKPPTSHSDSRLPAHFSRRRFSTR